MSKSASIIYLDKYLKDHKDDHLNFRDEVTWNASTGSMKFDAELGGKGFAPGAYKINGASYSGKSNCILQCTNNALKSVPNAKALWVKAEGRLSEEDKKRSGVNFVYSADEWKEGTCFVFETNIFERAIDLIFGLIHNNPEEIRYIICIDSVDCLIRKDDLHKEAAESEKVGAAGLLTSTMFKKINGHLNKLGHCLFMINQQRANVKVNQFEPNNQNETVGKGGANAPIHAANQVWNFKGRWKSAEITEDGSSNGEVIGHYCKLSISKGVNETIDVPVEYPIRHGRTNGKSVWVEREIIDLLLQWGFLEKKGSWINSDEVLTKFLGEEIKLQGISNLYAMLENDEKLTEKLKGFCKKEILEVDDI